METYQRPLEACMLGWSHERTAACDSNETVARHSGLHPDLVGAVCLRRSPNDARERKNTYRNAIYLFCI